MSGPYDFTSYVPPVTPDPVPPVRRRWTGVLVGLTVLAVLAGLAVEVVVLKGQGRPQQPSAAELAPDPAAAPEQAPAPRRQQAKEPPAVGTRVARSARADKVDSKPLLSALGSLTGAHLYQSYLNIGLLADGVEGEVYTPDQARKLLATVAGLMDAVERQLARLPSAGLGPAERRHIARTSDVLALLRTQAKELRAYWDSGKKEHAAAFHEARARAWSGIKDLLALEG
jgi:hypothetical protein